MARVVRVTVIGQEIFTDSIVSTDMNRRLVLANAALLASTTAGCTAAFEGPTAEPGTPSIPDEQDLPALPIEDTVRWAHEATDREIAINDISEPITLPDEIVIVLRNDSEIELAGNPYDWGLYKLHADEWIYVAPGGAPAPRMRVQPGVPIGHKHVLRHERAEVDTERFETEVPEDQDKYDPKEHPIHVGATAGLGGGRYALTISFSARDDMTHAVTFGVKAPAVELTPDEQASINIADETAVIEYDGVIRFWGHIEERLDVDRTDRELIPEQLSTKNYSPLRTGLATIRQHEEVTEAYVGFETNAGEFSEDESIDQLTGEWYARREVDGPA